ncbi:MAG: hypothetical protein WCH99_04990 [Verrucomicrobiota bacterium]
MNAICEIPEIRARILCLPEHNQNTIAAAVTGHSRNLTNDQKLAALTTLMGTLAACNHQAPFHLETLRRILGLTWGWLSALDVFDLEVRIHEERERQHLLFLAGKFTFTCASTTASFSRKLRVLVEEIGEVAEAIDHIEIKKPSVRLATESLRDELVQVAAVTVAWLESEEAK